MSPFDVRGRPSRQAAVRRPHGAGGSQGSPAGFLVALSGAARPPIHRLAVQPGAVARLEYQPRDGWSLVVRSRGAKSHKPVAAAVVSLESVRGYGAPNRAGGGGEDRSGRPRPLPGARRQVVDAGVRHPEFLPQTVPGLSAAPGGLAFRDVELEEGGRVRARVRVRGRARQGAVCKLKDVTRPVPPPRIGLPRCSTRGERIGKGSAGRALPRRHLSPRGRAGGRRSDPQASRRPEGWRGGGGRISPLFEIRVRGTVTGGGEPVRGSRSPSGSTRRSWGVREAGTGDERQGRRLRGHPRETGTLRLRSPLLSGGSAPRRARAGRRGGGGESTVDFSLERAAVHGKVVDEEGEACRRGLGDAVWSSAANETYQTADARGEFEFLLEEPGPGGSRGGEDGYRNSERQDVALEDGPSAPLVLVLAREKSLPGDALLGRGPARGGRAGWRAAEPLFGDERIRDGGRTDDAGRFEVPLLGGRRNRLFASGPGCPLLLLDPVDANGEAGAPLPGAPRGAGPHAD